MTPSSYAGFTVKFRLPFFSLQNFLPPFGLQTAHDKIYK